MNKFGIKNTDDIYIPFESTDRYLFGFIHTGDKREFVMNDNITKEQIVVHEEVLIMSLIQMIAHARAMRFHPGSGFYSMTMNNILGSAMKMISSQAEKTDA